MNFQLPPALAQQGVISHTIPPPYRKYQLPFADCECTVIKSSWGIIINQQVEFGEYTYAEQYFEPVRDIELQITVNAPLLALHGMYKGDILIESQYGNIHLKSGKLAIHSISPAACYQAKLTGGEVYHSVYIIPAVSLLNMLQDTYGDLERVLNTLKQSTYEHVSLPNKVFNATFRRKINNLKNIKLMGQARLIYSQTRLSDLIMDYIASLAQKNSHQNQLIEMNNEAIDNLLSEIDQHPDTKVSLEEAAQTLGISKSVLEVAVKQKKGKTLVEYARAQRMEHAKRLLETTDLSINKIAKAVGYTAPSYFRRIFRVTHRITPNAYRMRLLSQ